MAISRRFGAVLAATLVGAAASAVTFAEPSFAAGCSDSWQGPTTGVQAWGLAANWTAGIPTSSSDVCIAAAGTYTVDLTGGTSVNSIKVGGTSGVQTLLIDGTSSSVGLSLAAGTSNSITAHGALGMTATPSGYALIGGGTGTTLTNNGQLTTSSVGGSAPVYLRVPITNTANGTVTIGSVTTTQDSATVIANSGNVTVSAGAVLSLSGNSGFTNAAGTLTVSGTLTQSSGTFTASGGTESGNPVVLTGGTLADGAGTGSFDLLGSTTLTGDIPTGQTVTVDGTNSSVQTSFSGTTTVHGSLVAKAAPNGYAMFAGAGSVTVASGGALTTTGSGNPAYLRTPITVNAGGSFTISAPDSRLDNSTAISNAGTLTVTDGGHLSVSSGSTLVEGSAATLGVTVNATSGIASGITGPGVTAAGQLSVTTIGAPTVGTSYAPITGPVTGTFSSLEFGPHGYTVTYPSGAVVLTAKSTFSVSSSLFTPHKNIATGAVQVATIGSAANGTGTYSASVSWGDATPTANATVNVTGATGTVTAPSHTYTSAGSFTVTVTVHNTDGTTLTTSAVVVVPALTVTGISPLTGTTHGGTTVTVTGTGFTGATAVSFGGVAGTGISVVSDTSLTVVSPAHAAGKVDVQVTTPGGTSPKSAADRYTYKVPIPTVSAVLPNKGPSTGGTSVTITGTGFTGASAVSFGGLAATSFTVVSDTQITATSPAQAVGLVDVRVTTVGGTSPKIAADHFQYKPPVPTVSAVTPNKGPAAGGTTVTITGTGLTGATSVFFGTGIATGVVVVSDTQITAVSPVGAVGTVYVRVTTAGGTSAKLTADRFFYR